MVSGIELLFWYCQGNVILRKKNGVRGVHCLELGMEPTLVDCTVLCSCILHESILCRRSVKAPE